MLTLLLDLDDTLLQNSSHTFVEAYLRAWSDFVSPQFDPQVFVRALLAGTQQVERNLDPGCTLRSVFDSVFYTMIGSSKEAFKPLEERFYREIFPTLRSITKPIPGVEAIVKHYFEGGVQVAIATNPYFPLTAIEQRLAWAGLPVSDYPFALVPSIETFHFGKPNTAFFAELLSKLAWPEGCVVMVGDDLEKDILPAQKLGLATYWLTDQNSTGSNYSDSMHAQGTLSELSNWLDQIDGRPTQINHETAEGILASLRSTPAALDTLCAPLLESDWVCRPHSGEWCPAEIMCHLRDVDLEVNIPRIKEILDKENPFITGMDTDRWIEERQYHFQDGADALRNFIQTRKYMLALLENLEEVDWHRPARHSIFGRTDLAELTGFIADHDQLHIRQFFHALNPIAD